MRTGGLFQFMRFVCNLFIYLFNILWLPMAAKTGQHLMASDGSQNLPRIMRLFDFGRNHAKYYPALRVDAADLCPSTTHRHLGITLDPRLSFQTHINSVTSNFRRRIVLLSYMSPNLTPALIARLFKGYVRPSIEYASPLWNNKLTAANIDTLERLQARVARQYLHRRKVPIPHGMENVFEAAEWESLAWRRHIHCLKLFYHFTRQYPETLNNLNIVLSKSARRPHFYLLPTHTGPCFRSTLLHSMITTWNSLRPHFYLLPTHTGPCFRSTLLHSMITVVF